MKRKSLLIMLLAAFFVPLAMNAQTRSLHSPKLDKLEMNSAVARENAQNEMFVKSPVQIPNLESRNFSLENANNAMGSSITRDGVTYELVTTSQSDWSGNYVMAVPFSETVGYGFDGTIDDNTGGITQVTLENATTMTSIGDAAVLTIAPSSSGYYTIKINGGDYLTDGTNGLETSSTETNYTNWAISLTSDGMQLYNPVWSGGPYYLYFLYFENTSSGGAGAFFLTDDGTSYTSETVEGYEFEYIFPYLYKEVSSGGGNDCDYEKVTASQSDWSGDYVITYTSGTTAYVLTGKNANGNYGAYTTATIDDNTLANADVAAYNVTIEPVTYNNQTKYTLKIGNTYLGYTSNSNSGNNYLYFATSIPTTNPQMYYWTISYSNNTVTLTSVYNTRRTLKWNSNQPRFACYTSGQNAITLFKKLTDCAPACPTPTNLTYSNVTGEGATLAWNGEADSYTIQIGPAPKTYGFEDGTLQGWTAYDADGDGYSWNADNSTSSSGATYYHSGTYYAMASYNESAAVDNWLISPQIQLGGSISFWVRRLSTSYTDSYRVYVSTTNTDISSFREISSGTITPGTSYTQASYPLSSYSGTGYVAIRHTAAADQAYVFVDDITIVEGGQTISNATSPYTVTGLNPATEYVWQVKADCGDGNMSPWSASSTFTTLDLCATPTDLSSADITNNSAALSWTGLADMYNIQYREYDATAPATIILTAGDVWGDGTGYQMLLDADATAYDGGTISDYSIFEYKIPTNADYNASTSNVVVNNSVTIQIPAGTYDWFITNPTPGYSIYIAGSNGNVGGRQDNYVFEAGLTYEFVPSRYGNGDGVDVTITGWTPVSGTVTSPYTLTGLNPSTTYAWQVQGEGCDNWSASNIFTTLNGILVETISAANIDMVVGQTTTITPTILPTDATNQAVTYTSDDETVATVGENNGLVTAVGPGTATITIAATDGSGVTGTCTVTVAGIDVTGITANPAQITIITGETATISYTVAPAEATDQSVTFTSDDETVATVDAEGVVTGVGVGTATITITSVSNTEITATVEVTVTSNPNAVQFTVNAPANAAPGEVITVEAVLTAPTSGNYGGFNGLTLGIDYNPEAFQFVAGSIVQGPVAQAALQLDENAMIQNYTNITASIRMAIIVPTEGVYVTTEGVVFSAQFRVLAETGEYTFTAQPNIAGNFNHEADLIPYEATPSTVEIGALEQYTLTIQGYSGNKDNYYLIASPIGDVDPEDVTIQGVEGANMVSGTYDLYYFDQSKELEWINYRPSNGTGNPSSNSGFSLESGTGYLYANSETVTLVFTGRARNAEVDVPVTLVRDENAEIPGWNLLGNPYAVNAYLKDNDGFYRGFYTMDVNGNYISVTGDEINSKVGIFVEAASDGETVTFTTTEPETPSAKLALNLSHGHGLIDRAIVRFDGGDQLSKLQFRKGSTKVYIPMDGKDYAIVSSEEMGEMPVNFKAESNGTYNLSLNGENVEFAYLHLIDNLTGADIDLLETPSYSFDAKTTDYESRFKLVFATGNNSDTFAFFSNGSFVINNEGNAILQVIDVMGRIVKCESINGCANVNVNGASGVYMLRLVNGDNVKVQKVVVK